jgi:hypothetical protein
LKRLIAGTAFSALLLLTHSMTRGQTTYDYDVWSAATDTLRSAVTGARLNLGSAFIVPGSERVYVDSNLLKDDEYEINYRLGVIRIGVELSEGALVVVQYRRAPFTLQPVYSLREVEISEPGSGDTVFVSPPPASPRETGIESGNLVFGGTKSISFTVGNNRGTSLDQSLQASIEGQLTPTIKVKALLSDDNLPVQAEGNTEELEYLDKVYVEIEGSHAKTALGDFGFQNTISTFSPFTRQLKGISAEAWVDRGRVMFAGAQSKGEFRTIQFRGTTGLQGPYQLLSATRNTGEVVIAGTERVYVDGRLLARGQNRDYTIDYDGATVTFTPRVLITRDTEIAVDYEVTQQRYDRSTLFTAAESRTLPWGADLHVLFARERDDKDSPKNQTFTPEDIAILSAAGDDPTKALTSGVTPTDPGEGTYVLVPADTVAGIPEHFQFDDSTGNYDVFFVEVEEGNGDYEFGGFSRRGVRYYRFVGTGKGNYLVGRLLPLPESTSLVTARLQRLRGDHISLDAEWNVSEYDRNLFSSEGDGDNNGYAGQFQLGVKNLPVLIGRLGLSGSVNAMDDRFKSFDRARPPYYYRDWNLENVPLSGRETVEEYSAGVTRGEWAAVKYTRGRLDRDTIRGARNEGTLRIGGGEDRVLSGRAFDTRTVGRGEVRTRDHATATAAFGLWRVRPSVAYARERYLQVVGAEPDSGYAYQLYRARLSDRSSKWLGAAVQVEERDTEEIRDSLTAWTETRRDRTIGAELAVRGRGNVQGELQVTHREEENRLLRDTRSTDLARLKGFLRSSSAGLRADVDYEISQTAARALKRSVVFVGDGNGNYNESGELVGTGQGAFTVVFSPTTEVVPTNRVTFNFRFGWSSTSGRSRLTLGQAGAEQRTRGGVWQWIRSNVSLDQTLTVMEESTFDPAWKIYLMVPSALQRNEDTVFGSVFIRQDWTLLDAYKSVSLTFRYERRDDEDNRFEGVKEERFNGQHLVRLSRSVSSLLTATVEASRQVERRSGSGIDVAGGGAYDVRALAVLGGVGFQLPGGSSIDLDSKLTEREDGTTAAKQRLITLRPKTTWRLSRAISVFGSYELTLVQDEGITDVRPVVFSREGDSHRWNVTPTIRVSKYISIIAAYNGRTETVFSGQRITDHELRLETRAFF